MEITKSGTDLIVRVKSKELPKIYVRANKLGFHDSHQICFAVMRSAFSTLRRKTITDDQFEQLCEKYTIEGSFLSKVNKLNDLVDFDFGWSISDDEEQNSASDTVFLAMSKTGLTKHFFKNKDTSGYNNRQLVRVGLITYLAHYHPEHEFVFMFNYDDEDEEGWW